ncbi:protein bark beetle-like [Planococcus citri]|uniref:protein bark beetle-like n=1 Tax=Planococcus citri TaxID=170843 RepID=UPI0031F95BBD
MMGYFWSWCSVLATCSILLVIPVNADVYKYAQDSFSYRTTDNANSKYTELSANVISNARITLEKQLSPYIVKKDIQIEQSGELWIEPGVKVFFEPGFGITVRGILTAKGEPHERIVFTSAANTNENLIPESNEYLKRVRLVDGPNVFTGRLQIYHNSQWRSVCTNSSVWTKADARIICRQLGFQEGRFWKWMDRETGTTRPRLLLEKPDCRGMEGSIFDCKWQNRQLGSGVCDYHPDIGIECSARLEPLTALKHWRGIHFENAAFERTLTQQNVLYVRKSLSKLVNVDLSYAGSGWNYSAVSALQIEGVPPVISSCSISFSAFNGINVTDPQAPVTIVNSTISNNGGYGVYINSTVGGALLEGCTVEQNQADGVKYVHHEEPVYSVERSHNPLDFCTFPTTSSQTFPITVNFDQSLYAAQAKECHQTFYARSGQVLTLFFKHLRKSKQGAARIELYDGFSSTDNLLAIVNIQNLTRPQSVSTTGSNLFIKYVAQAQTEAFASVNIISSSQKWYDLSIVDSNVADNNGRGVMAENIQSQLYLKRASVSKNNHVAGVHVLHGAAYVNVSESRIAFNYGDGVNISYAGGVRNISESFISSNQGHGIAVWLNLTKRSDTIVREQWQPFEEYTHIPSSQQTVVAYNEIFKNLDSGILVGNFCGNSIVNVTGNWFNNSLGNCIEIQSCWMKEKEKGKHLMTVQIGHNYFYGNRKLGVKLSPLVNAETVVEYNYFSNHSFGAILIRNGLNEQLIRLPSKAIVEHNEFRDNSGVYVVNIGLSPYSETQKLLFTFNVVKDNDIKEPFGNGFDSKLIPRSKVAAPVVVSSENTHIYRNIIWNPDSRYEVGSHLEDQSLIINCTLNWLGTTSEENIYFRLFNRKDRYNLARIEYIPFLLHSSNPATTRILEHSTYVPFFHKTGSRAIGGEVDGVETLKAAEYIVERDINVRPGGRLLLEPGVTLRFPPGIGVMVAGKLEAKGRSSSKITLALKEERIEEVEQPPIAESDTMSPVTMMADEAVSNEPPKVPVRLHGGVKPTEGRLQVYINGKWGTVCNYGWTIEAASLVCHQLGYVLNPNDWFLSNSEISMSGTSDPVLLSNVKCTDEDLNILDCKAEKEFEFEYSCSHDYDVKMRCYEPGWAGLRFGVLAERSNLQYLSVERAGLLDYATNLLKPALQIDFNRHSLENVQLNHNLDDGLGIIYSDLYSPGMANVIRECTFQYNEGAGMSIKQFGAKVSDSSISNNKVAGVRHDPVINAKQQKEIAGWFKMASSDYTVVVTYAPQFLPRLDEKTVIDFGTEGETKHFITERIHSAQAINKTYILKAKPNHYVLGIQILNPPHNESTEKILIYDNPTMVETARIWDLKRDLMSFPTTSRTHGIVLRYESGLNAMGNVVIVITCTSARKEPKYPRLLNYESFPTLLITKSRIRENGIGIWNSHYNSYLSEFGDHYLRKSNETLALVDCDITKNDGEVILVESLISTWSYQQSNISETTIIVNNSQIFSNRRGFRQFNWDQRNSNNLFHWHFYKNTINQNEGGGFEIMLPYVWSYNENYTHTVVQEENYWESNRNFAFIVDGHYAQVNLTKNIFQNNDCKEGLISIRGMEKSMSIAGNKITGNRGIYLVEFKANSQSEIRGELRAIFYENILEHNTPSRDDRTSVIVFDGIQRVRIRRNLISSNGLTYALVAGVKTARIDSALDVSDNWWGTTDYWKIKKQIFDFDDWNDHALANFQPHLIQNDFNSPISVSWDNITEVDLNNLSGRLFHSLVLKKRDQPYQILYDLTVMPNVTLTIDPGVTIEFGPKVGLLVLGTLIAKGKPDDVIRMIPFRRDLYHSEEWKNTTVAKSKVRLCADNVCTGPKSGKRVKEGFLEYFNSTTSQWVPICDETFVEQNARVVCRQLGLDSLNVWVSKGRRYEFLPNALTRIWSWPEQLQCSGEEETLDECPLRLNELPHVKRYTCQWDSSFVFIHCGGTDRTAEIDYWGGIRFANKEFEWNNYGHVHDPVTHDDFQQPESVLEHVEVIGAGMLHYHKSPAILAVVKSPLISYVNVTQSASHGINLVSPEHNVKLLHNKVESCLDTGISIASLTGEGRETSESSFVPAERVDLPYNVFSMLDMCDPLKEIVLQERILLYYKYTNSPVSCIKIFHSAYPMKTFGFRFLQLNLFNETDTLSLYDGSIYNVSSPIIATVSSKNRIKKQFITTKWPSMSVKMMVSGASHYHGFIAEIVTLPISAITFNRDILHNVSSSILKNNWGGALYYVSAGEVNPRFTMEKNQITGNCVRLYGNFTTCESAVTMDLQNTQNVYFRNNLISGNIGGLWIKADSEGSATSVKAIIHNNLFSSNKRKSTLKIEGRRSSPYQNVVLYRNYFAINYSPFENVIVLNQVMSNFTLNYIQSNIGSHILEISGFERVRQPTLQTTSHNSFYWNYAVERDSKSTVLAGTAGQSYIDNIFSNPDNDFEMITVNSTVLDVWNTPLAPVNARYNYWGFNETYAVGGRIHDHQDDFRLLEVDFLPFHLTNDTLLDVKCPPAWNLVGDTCYMYIGAPMTFYEARDFCSSVNASMPYVMVSYHTLYQFLKHQEERYMFFDAVWVQNLNRINTCTAFVRNTIEEDDCQHLHAFICEMDPKVTLNVLSWRHDVLTIAVFSSIVLAFLLLSLVAVLWYSKSKHRHTERLQRRNSIRQSLNSLRSISSSQTAFNDFSYKRKTLSGQTNLSLTRAPEYKKMNGSVDSMDKSQFNSSLEEDTQSYDIYEAHNPNAAALATAAAATVADRNKNNFIDLSYQNHGYRTNSSFASHDDDDRWPSSSYMNNCSTLPLASNLGISAATDPTVSTISSKQDYQCDNEYQEYYERPKSSATILETNFDVLKPSIASRSKSETLLETNFDYMMPSQDVKYSAQMNDVFSAATVKSKSQPLETAM